MPLVARLGGGSSAQLTICGGATYAERTDVELIFGRTNIYKWADVDNEEDDDFVAQRICWALQESYAYFNDRLRSGPYTIPFSTPPARVISMSARWAGVILYDARGISDTSDDKQPKHQLSAHRDMVVKFLNELLSSKARLDLEENGHSYPEVVE